MPNEQTIPVSEINVEAKLVKEGGFVRTEENMVEMKNGCMKKQL
ncbi:hypothetical protein ACTNEO_14690 [Gracilibacillus sp. HCP3S3_G5_1]